ncbi:MAG: ABC transporter substrate-binding protein [Acutalibacteraceae bacterium]
MKPSVKRILSSLAAAAMAAVLLAGCSSDGSSSESSSDSPVSGGASAAEKVSVKVTGLKGPTGVGLVNLWKSQDDGAAKNDYAFYLAEAPEDAKNRLVTGDADIAAVPTNVAAALYKATGGKVKLLAVNTLGVLQIVEKGDTIQSVADLRGKTIYTTGQGANPEYVLNYVLEKNGIDPARDVTIEFVSTNDELATLLATDENVKVAMIPEPSATTVKAKDDSLRTALDMTKAWDEASGGASRLMMGCVAVRTEFAEAHPEAIKAFLEEYEASLKKAREDMETTAQLCETYGVIPKAAVALKALPGCNLTFAVGEEMKAQISGYYQVLFDANPKSIGGELPDDGFYYMAE